MGDPRGRIKAAQKTAMKEGTTPTTTERPGGKKPPVAKKVMPIAIVRVAGTDLDGNKQVAIALMKIRGVGYNLARVVLHAAGIEHTTKLRDISEEQTAKIESVIEKPAAFGIPIWMLNRQKDPATGENVHVSGSDLPLVWRQDIENLKRIRAYRGIRHETGLPTRGQHTRTSGRKGTRVGVVRKKALAAPAKAAAAEKGKEKK